MKEKGQKLKICAKKARAANKRRVAFLAKIATRWIYFIHIFRQLLVPNLSKSEQKNSVLALGAYYTDYLKTLNFRVGGLPFSDLAPLRLSDLAPLSDLATLIAHRVSPLTMAPQRTRFISLFD